MSTENTELLERAVINLTLQNAKLQQDITKTSESKNMWYKWYNDKNELLEKKENEFLSVNKKLSELEHFKTTVEGLWAFDKIPSEVTAEWIKENAFQISENEMENVYLHNVNTEEESE